MRKTHFILAALLAAPLAACGQSGGETAETEAGEIAAGGYERGPHNGRMLRDGDFSEIEMVLTLRDQLFESIAEAIKSELSRINEARSNTKASMLYLTILTETKNMVLQSRNLLKSQQYFLKHRTGPQKWIK